MIVLYLCQFHSNFTMLVRNAVLRLLEKLFSFLLLLLWNRLRSQAVSDWISGNVGQTVSAVIHRWDRYRSVAEYGC